MLTEAAYSDRFWRGLDCLRVFAESVPHPPEQPFLSIHETSSGHLAEVYRLGRFVAAVANSLDDCVNASSVELFARGCGDARVAGILALEPVERAVRLREDLRHLAYMLEAAEQEIRSVRLEIEGTAHNLESGRTADP